MWKVPVKVYKKEQKTCIFLHRGRLTIYCKGVIIVMIVDCKSGGNYAFTY